VWLVERENEEALIKEIKSFYSIITFLNNENYIDIIQVDIIEGNLPPIVKSTFVLFSELLDLIILMSKMQVVKRSSLQTFIDNKYKTSQELFYESEKKARKISQWIAIFIGAGSLIFSALFNYITYTTNRNVIITKMPNNRDTVTVKIIDRNPQQDLNNALNK
jgi:hypothetical protein